MHEVPFSFISVTCLFDRGNDLVLQLLEMETVLPEIDVDSTLCKHPKKCWKKSSFGVATATENKCKERDIAQSDR